MNTEQDDWKLEAKIVIGLVILAFVVICGLIQIVNWGVKDPQPSVPATASYNTKFEEGGNYLCTYYDNSKLLCVDNSPQPNKTVYLTAEEQKCKAAGGEMLYYTMFSGNHDSTDFVYAVSQDDKIQITSWACIQKEKTLYHS